MSDSRSKESSPSKVGGKLVAKKSYSSAIYLPIFQGGSLQKFSFQKYLSDAKEWFFGKSEQK